MRVGASKETTCSDHYQIMNSCFYGFLNDYIAIKNNMVTKNSEMKVSHTVLWIFSLGWMVITIVFVVNSLYFQHSINWSLSETLIKSGIGIRAGNFVYVSRDQAPFYYVSTHKHPYKSRYETVSYQ